MFRYLKGCGLSDHENIPHGTGSPQHSLLLIMVRSSIFPQALQATSAHTQHLGGSRTLVASMLAATTPMWPAHSLYCTGLFLADSEPGSKIAVHQARILRLYMA